MRAPAICLCLLLGAACGSDSGPFFIAPAGDCAQLALPLCDLMRVCGIVEDIDECAELMAESWRCVDSTSVDVDACADEIAQLECADLDAPVTPACDRLAP